MSAKSAKRAEDRVRLDVGEHEFSVLMDTAQRMARELVPSRPGPVSFWDEMARKHIAVCFLHLLTAAEGHDAAKMPPQERLAAVRAAMQRRDRRRAFENFKTFLTRPFKRSQQPEKEFDHG